MSFPVRILALAAILLVAACGGDDSDPSAAAGTTDSSSATTVSADSSSATTVSADSSSATTATTDGSSATTVSADGISEERCAANREAGTITYLSGFDLAATASIIEVVLADENGYFEDMCLDVDVKSSFSTANYPLVGADTAQFASSGSFNEMLAASTDGAELVAVVHSGKTGIDALMVRPELGVESPADLAGATIGVKGALPPGERAMLAQDGLVEGNDYQTVTVEGFDPLAHWELPIDALPVFKSNEPGQLERAGIDFQLLDPAEYGIPGSFGIIYTNRQFLDDHPTAAQDFVRAAMRGMEDALADPDAATAVAFGRITDNGNLNFLSMDGELFRWRTEAEIVVDSSDGEPVGLVHGEGLERLLQAYVDAGVLDAMPDHEGTYDEALIAGVYGPDGKVIWPAAG